MIAALVVANLGQLAVLAYLIRQTTAERKQLTAAALQANNLPDAARTFARADADARRRVEAQLAAAKEGISQDGTFSAANPWGRPEKPIGV